jgi:hypothetical protein
MKKSSRGGAEKRREEKPNEGKTAEKDTLYYQNRPRGIFLFSS